jgi:hypothetical protein
MATRHPAKTSGTPVRVAFGVMAGALALGALLNAPSLVAAASAQPPGPVRTVALPVAEGLGRVGEALRLDRLHAWFTSLAHPERTGQGEGPRPVFVPTPNRKATLLVAGDSLVDPFGPEMVALAEATGLVTGRWEVQYSSGLTRPQLFDWSDWLEEDLVGVDMVVFMVGANDSQPIETPSGWASTGTPEWAAEHGRRVDEMMTLLESRVATVYWVGQPIGRSSEHSARMAVLNDIYEEAATGHDRVRYVDSWEVFTDSDGAYSDFLTDETGRLVLMRQPDGIHFTPEGARRLAQRVLDVIGADWAIAR